MNRKVIAAAFFLLPSLALAHPGHESGFAAAFAHPFTGIDHLLMMLCVGIFAGRIGGKARWQLPLAFLLAMTAGWILAAAGHAFAGLESGIAAGLLVLGVLFLLRRALPLALHAGVVALFALLHGMAHGIELSRAAPIMTSAGFLAATALLHAAGLGAADWLPAQNRGAYCVLGILLSALGGGLLLAG